MKKILILGTGCAKCKQLAENARLAADQAGVSCEIEKITDVLKFADYGVMMTPALVMDGKVIVAGKVPSVQDLAGRLA